MRRRIHAAMPIGFCLGLLVLAACSASPATNASRGPVPALSSGMARVWVLRPPTALHAKGTASDPMVFANGAPLARSAQGTLFFHDFAPGSYHFTVKPRSTQANLVDTLQLAPGMEVYLQIQAVANGEAPATAGAADFAVLPMTAAEAKPYLPNLHDLGQR
jgi:hypothetical protein